MRDWSWLYGLGYTQEEIAATEKNWEDGILDLLAEPIFAYEYQKNAKLLLDYYDRDELLIIMICHTISFQTRPDLFRSRVEELGRELGEEWYDVAYQQFWSAQEDCIFDALWYRDEADWQKALAGLIAFGQTNYADMYEEE